MSHVDLTTHIGKTLALTNPFWIASSHYSENAAVVRSWREHNPAAITLKTCTRTDRTETKRVVRVRTQPFLARYGRAFYSDGPKTKELKSYEETIQLLDEAKKVLPGTKVGVSVLATDQEDFQDLRNRCEKADFWELNLKYSMRSKTEGESFFESRKTKWRDTLVVVRRFLETFQALPVFIKTPRELEWLPLTQEAGEMLDFLKSHGDAGIIVANSRKANIGAFIYGEEEQHLRDGVLCGDPLYDSTLTMIENLRAECSSRGIPIVASGGMVDEQQALMALRSGATAVQLCTAFDYNGPVFYGTLVSGLESRMKWRGVTEMAKFVEQLRNEGVASVFGMPFSYSPSFWAEDFQKQIRQDIRFSNRMDFPNYLGANSVYEVDRAAYG